MNCEKSLRNHDQTFLKWRIILQNEDVDQKSWSLTVLWATVDFWPSTFDFQASEQLTEQTSCARHETWHGWSWEHIGTMEGIWYHWTSNILIKMGTLVWGTLPLERVCLVNFLGILEQVEDLNGHVLSKMRGQILGYNSGSLYNHRRKPYRIP